MSVEVLPTFLVGLLPVHLCLKIFNRFWTEIHYQVYDLQTSSFYLVAVFSQSK